MWQIGIVVPDRDTAMAAMSDVFGVTWVHALQKPRRHARRRAQDPRSPDRDRPTGSSVHLELIGAVDGSPWDPGHGLDHIAYWADDLAGTAASMEAAGAQSRGDVSGRRLAAWLHLSPGRIRASDRARRFFTPQRHDELDRRWRVSRHQGRRRGSNTRSRSPTTATRVMGRPSAHAFHIGAAVTDLEAAMEELTAGTRVRVAQHPGSIDAPPHRRRRCRGAGAFHVQQADTPHRAAPGQ